MIRVMDGDYVPPEHLAALDAYMADKPGDWYVIASDIEACRYTLSADIGDGVGVEARIQLNTGDIFERNKQLLNDSSGKRFGDGVIAASIPMAHLYDEKAGNLGRAFAEGDYKHIRKKLNDPDLRNLRTFRGKL